MEGSLPGVNLAATTAWARLDYDGHTTEASNCDRNGYVMEQGTIKIHSSFFFLQFVFFIFKPTISIDSGEPTKPGWGESTHSVAPGQHTVHVEIPYLFTKVGKATETVNVGADETVAMTYRPPIVVFMKGKLRRAIA
jgi:hypothetical protein